MYELHTEIRINAPADRVWEVLTDFEAYVDWNPFVRSLEGSLEPGKTLKVTLEQPESKPMVMQPKVVGLEPGRGFKWLGHLGIPKIFDGEHRFELEAREDGTTRFIHAERFGGILVPFFKSMLENKTRRGFEQMNEALRQRVEA